MTDYRQGAHCSRGGDEGKLQDCSVQTELIPREPHILIAVGSLLA